MAIKQLIDDPRISSVVFYPRKTSIPNDLPDEIKALNFQISEDILIGGYCFIKDSNLPTILFFHGNGEIALDYRYFYEIFFECDVNLAVADFRGYGHLVICARRERPVYLFLVFSSMSGIIPNMI